jgi:flagellar hook-length control protein FliK
MNLESIGIQQGAAQGQAQGAKSAAGNDALAALFADFLGLADALAGGTAAEPPKRDEPSAQQQGAALMAIAGAPFLPLPVAAQTAAAAQNGIAAPTAAVLGATDAKPGAAGAPLNAIAAGQAEKPVAPGVAGTEPATVAVQPVGSPLPQPAAATPAEPKAQPEAAAPADAAVAVAVQAEAALPQLAIKLAPSVTLEAPKTVAAVGAEKQKPVASSGSSTKSTAPVSVTLEKAAEPARSGAAPLPSAHAPVAAAAPSEAKDQPATAPAKPELAEAAAPSATLAAATPAAHLSTDKPIQPQAPATPMHPASEQLAQRVEKAIEHGEDRIRIELSPASLGGVEVQLQIADDGRVSAVVRADRADTLALLQNDARGLEQALRDAGLRPDAGSLTFNLRQGEGQAGHQADTRGQRRRGNSEPARFAIEGVDGDAAGPRDLLRGLDIRI